jgi:hypothetical protein
MIPLELADGCVTGVAAAAVAGAMATPARTVSVLMSLMVIGPLLAS